MGKENDIKQSVPEMETMTEVHKLAINDFLSQTDDLYGSEQPFLLSREDTEEGRQLLAYRFLKARKWNVSAAVEMLKNTIKFRAEQGLDTCPLFPSAFPILGYDEEEFYSVITAIPGCEHLTKRSGVSDYDLCYRALQTSYVNLYHYFDKTGHPVLYDCCGRADATSIIADLTRLVPPGKNLADVIVPYHTYMNEVQYYLIRYADAVSQRCGGQCITGVTVVMDLDGLSMSMIQKKFIKIIEAIFQVDQRYYPEVLHRLFVINCPGFIRFAYGLVKGTLDEHTRSKIMFCNRKDSMDVLRQVIDDEKIPRELGGTCTCAGGCLPRYKNPAGTHADPNDSSLTVGDTEHVRTEEVTINARSQLQREYYLSEGSEVRWEFAVIGNGGEISFLIEFQPQFTQSNTSLESSNVEPFPPIESHVEERNSIHGKRSSSDTSCTPERKVVKKEKLATDVNVFRFPSDGVLYLSWDNRNSWIHRKQLQLHITTHENT